MVSRERVDILDIFRQNSLVKACAPMVRYSKLEFRSLVRKYGCQLSFTPMIMADSFVQSVKARHNEFVTSRNDKPVIVQFAAKTVDDFVYASELVSPFCDGVDLNCGCPQRWAMSDGYGAELLSKPEMIKDMVKQLKSRVPNNFSVSVKMRLMNDIRHSVELCRDLEAAGVTFLTVHGRTANERSEPVHYDDIKTIVQSVNVPVIANGDIKSLDDAYQMKELTECDGVMAARGILQNPAMYSGATITPLSCVQDWINLSLNSTLHFQFFHHHLVFMLEKVFNKKQRNIFNHLKTFDTVTQFLCDHLNIEVPDVSSIETAKLEYNDVKDGSYFRSKITETQDDFEEYIGDFCTYIETA